MSKIRDWFLSLTLMQGCLVFLLTVLGLGVTVWLLSWLLTPAELPCDC